MLKIAIIGVLILTIGFISTESAQAASIITPRCGTAPSGAVMPLGDITGWKQVFADDFNGTALNSTAWGAYEGQPGGDPLGFWSSTHVAVNNCRAIIYGNYDNAIKSGIFVTGGIGMKGNITTPYGKYLVRMRLDRGNGISAIALLWPQAPVWPPEIDFYEDPGGERTQTSAFLHCGPNGNDNCRIEKQLSTYDFKQWHTVGVEWLPGQLNYTIDGTVWATVSDPGVPSIPMNLAIQTQAVVCTIHNTCLDGTTPANVNMEIDWVVAYQSAPVGTPDSIGVYKGGIFYLRNSLSTGVADTTSYFGGDPSDMPVAGDWNGDGIDTIGIYRSSTANYYLSGSNYAPSVAYTALLGIPGDAPLAGRWTPEMTWTGIGVYRNSNGILYLKKYISTGYADYFAIFGKPGDQGVVGDWNADGYDSVGVYRSSEATWYLSNNYQPGGVTYADMAFAWNIGSAIPIVGDWGGTKLTTAGYYNNGTFVLHSANAAAGTNNTFFFGMAGARPIAGRWVAAPDERLANLLVAPVAGAAFATSEPGGAE